MNAIVGWADDSKVETRFCAEFNERVAYTRSNWIKQASSATIHAKQA